MIFFLFSCASFIKDNDIDTVREFEKEIYILQNDVVAGNRVLKKGQEVKIIVVPDDEWIKVYGYPVKEGLLKGERVLILYMFEDDFPGEAFDMNLFKKNLSSIVREKELRGKNDKVK